MYVWYLKMHPPFKNFHAIVRIALIFPLFVVNMVGMTYVGYLTVGPLFGITDASALTMGNMQTLAEVNAFLYLQAMSSLGGFALTAFMFARLSSYTPIHNLGLRVRPSLRMLLLAFVSVLVAQFFIEYLVTINKSVNLPPSIAETFRASQQKAEAIINKLLDFKDPIRLIPVAFVMAVVPAFGEELFFRGLLMGTFLRAKMNPIAAIIVSGFLFAVVHFEFDNTLAIWVLGSFLGYLYYVSGSLWLPIAAHFVNNFLTVLLKYLLNIGVISADIAEASTPWYATVISVVLFGACLFLFNKWKQPVDFEEEDDDDDNTESELIPVQ